MCDEAEARSEPSERTRLWERWSLRAAGVCPFGIVLWTRGKAAAAPFRTWSYLPAYLPVGLSIEFAEGVPLDEPELLHLPFVHGPRPASGKSVQHRVPIRTIDGVVVAGPAAAHLSEASQAARAALTTAALGLFE